MDTYKDIYQFVVENGRVTGDGDDWFDSLEVEMEFECNERGMSTANLAQWIATNVS